MRYRKPGFGWTTRRIGSHCHGTQDGVGVVVFQLQPQGRVFCVINGNAEDARLREDAHGAVHPATHQ